MAEMTLHLTSGEKVTCRNTPWSALETAQIATSTPSIMVEQGGVSTIILTNQITHINHIEGP